MDFFGNLTIKRSKEMNFKEFKTWLDNAVSVAEVFCHFTEIEYGFYQKIIDSKKVFDNKQKEI